MQIDQRRVTSVNLQDGRVRDCFVHQDNRGFRLSFVSKDEVVNVYLTTGDVQKVRQELGKHIVSEGRREFQPHFETKHHRGEPQFSFKETFSPTAPSEPFVLQWSNLDWLSYN